MQDETKTELQGILDYMDALESRYTPYEFFVLTPNPQNAFNFVLNNWTELKNKIEKILKENEQQQETSVNSG